MPSSEELCYDPEVGDPAAYDRRAVTYLIALCNEPIARAVAALKEERLAFDSMQRLHDDSLDIELIFRQSIPSTGLAIRLGLPVAEITRFIVIFAKCQTLILNHMDRHLDLSSSYTLRDPELLLRDARSVMCYAVTSLYGGMLAAAEVPTGSATLQEMAKVSINIVQSMHDNYVGRFSRSELEGPHSVIQRYEHPVLSRHVGSGFYDSSIAGLYAYFNLPKPPDLTQVLQNMRKLRQRVDELADLYEDTTTGLISYPVARLLTSSTYTSEATRTIEALWAKAQSVISSVGHDAGLANAILLNDPELQLGFSVLLDLLRRSGALMHCYDEAARLWCDVRREIDETLTPGQAEILKIVVDLKRALLDRISSSGWIDTPPDYTFYEMRESAIKGKQ